MHTQMESGFERAEAVRTLREGRRERARVIASLAEYLAADVQEHPHRAVDAMASLAEWCDGDEELLAEARIDVLRDTPAVQASAGETNRGAAELLELLAEHS
ncbi:MAG: hypothetical protein M3046_16195 [Actinomycetota bacterium]|jgi:hypothetical protein|nr:hypothetical protein [Actinomycetota bacterium]